MDILLVGGGGREHALAWAIGASPLCDQLWVAPGNAGIAADAEANAICVDIKADDVDGLVRFAVERKIGLVVVGPEAPLTLGLVDRLTEAGIKAFGPSAAAARLEGSKGFMKDLCATAGIPTARYRRFADAEDALAYVRAEGAPIVIKADGLAAGKGVVVATTVKEAEEAVVDALSNRRFGAAGAEIVVEECMTGPEVSFFALVDGTTALPLATAQDHKRAHDDDQGPNTGGMGAFSPSPLIDQALEANIMRRIIEPTVAAMAAGGTPFKGVLYAGLMLTAEGPKLLEYNVRFGDPEAQVLMMRLKSDLVPAMLASIDGELAHFALRWQSEAAVTVVMATQGYPGTHGRGSVIRGLERAAALSQVKVFHAATRRDASGLFTADGGRVLAVTALGPTIAEARARAYEAVDLIDWPDGFFRRDIAAKAASES